MRTIASLSVIILLASCSKPEQQLPPPPVAIVMPSVRDVPIYNEYIGHIEATESVQVTAQIAGHLVQVNFTEGQEVKQGQLLFTIDPRPYQAALQKAQGVFAQTLASLEYNEETVKRYSSLVKEDYISQLSYDQFRTNVLVDEAMIKQNIADIEVAKLNLEYCYIRAPFDAIAGYQQIDIGNFIPVGGNPLVVLNQVTPIVATFYIPERDLPQIQELQRNQNLCVQGYINRNFDKPYDGVLNLINNQVDENTGTILLKASFPNEDKSLWPGQFVDVRVILKVQKDAILLPTQAVQVGQNTHYVFIVKDDSTVEQRDVKIGQVEGDETIIESGVSPNEKVVLKGQIELYTGAKVTVVSGGTP